MAATSRWPSPSELRVVVGGGNITPMDAAVVKFISIVSQNPTLKEIHGSARPAKKPAKKATDDE